ncbi:hypothetical protein PRJBM_01427 [Bartonella henselae]|nr:hypothetical protein Q654_01445 [Bartonella henselae JK 50]ETS06069.1 hypothetical protein Q655_01393 [Bartonella henselae JK 51]ETS10934.1 hypothetical protein Q653_00468 [Bartonella henselae JK 42]ETS13791.1 hypothetical protein Q652_00601 [Bartonella henselae JK 41]CDO40773.1 hypothetical protein PRJBM_01427 [Bartonella henselae]
MGVSLLRRDKSVKGKFVMTEEAFIGLNMRIDGGAVMRFVMEEVRGK